MERYINKVHHRDCLDLMQEMPKGQIDLIYIDPPFCCEADKKFGMIAWNKNIQPKNRVDEILPLIEEQDIGMANYLRWMYPRLYLMKELLSDEGSIYVHLDWHVCHYVKILMDELFGKNNFRDDITWEYQGSWVEPKTYYPHRSQNILFYVKNAENNYIFNRLYEEEKTDKGVIKRWEKFIVDGKIYGKSAPYGDCKFEPYLKRFIKENNREPLPDDIIAEFKGRSIGDVWYVSMLNPISPENCNYKTQKPEALLERIINSSTNENSIVADFFAGSGTTLAVAEKLGRKWIGCDTNKQAVKISRNRLEQLVKESEVENCLQI